MMCITCCCEGGFDRSTYEVSALHDIKSDLHKSAALQHQLLRQNFCLEALQWATGQNPCLQLVGEAPISWEQHLSPMRRKVNWTWLSTTSLIQANLQHSITAARVLSRTVTVKE